MTSDATIELFSARVCPYAHRTRLVLAEKGLEFDLTEIDFQNKPERFLKISRYGKVPAIVHDGNEIYESAIINEYLEEVFPDPPLMPQDPGRRAQVRIWIDFCDDHFLDDLYGAIRNQDAGKHAELKAKVETHLRTLEGALARLSGAGPYWLGREASLLDFALYPFFERLPAWAHYRGLGIPDDCPRLAGWFAAMAERPSVRAIANTPEYYIERYQNYAKVVLAA
ncbi:MAG TPA: glutathione S-transferase family protein [Acidobacteriota bacterium]